MPKILDGKKLSKIILEKYKKILDKRIEDKKQIPSLAVIQVGIDPASSVYIRHKEKACARVGIRFLGHRLAEDISEEELIKLIEDLNQLPDVSSILVQLPLPDHINTKKILEIIDPRKDADGFHRVNMGQLLIDAESRDYIPPCTPAGIMELLDYYEISISGKHCVVLGRSNIVGKPIAMMMLARNATVTICHSRTKNLAEITRQADIIVAAIGRPNFLIADMIREGVVLVDVGINRLDNGKLCGDIDFLDCEQKASAITPVPGGVGPMTIAGLIRNVITDY